MSSDAAASKRVRAFFDPIASPLGGWSCDYYFYLTILTFLFGATLCAHAAFVLITAPKSFQSKGLIWGAVGLALALIPVALSYFTARVQYSMCAASIGRDVKK